MSDGLFDIGPVEPKPDPYEGMGQDAKRNAKYLELIAQGVNPGTRMRFHADAAKGKTGEGLRCRDCRFLFRKTGDFQGSFLKCENTIIRNDVRSTGPDMRGWWPACSMFKAVGDA